MSVVGRRQHRTAGSAPRHPIPLSKPASVAGGFAKTLLLWFSLRIPVTWSVYRQKDKDATHLVSLLSVAEDGHLRQKLPGAKGLVEGSGTVFHRCLAQRKRQLQHFRVVAFEAALKGLGGLTWPIRAAVDLPVASEQRIASSNSVI